MKLTIRYVKEHGVLKDERIVLKALDDVNLGAYMLADTAYITADEVSSNLRHTYWIPDKNVQKGDLVVIYTKRGQDSTAPNQSGHKTHFLYWGLERPVWNRDKDAAALFRVGDWYSKKV